MEGMDNVLFLVKDFFQIDIRLDHFYPVKEENK